MTDAPAGGSRIFDQGYRPFQGSLASVRTRFLVIAGNQFRQAWREKWFRRLAVVAFFPLGVFGVLAVVRSRLSIGEGASSMWVHFWSLQVFFSMLVTFYLGRNAIGEDLRSGGLLVYFSRPVSFQQYVGGKWLAVALGVAAVTLAPGLVLALFQWLVLPDASLPDLLRWLGALLLLTGLLCLVSGGVVLALSAVAGRGRVAGILWVVLFLASSGVAEALVEGTGIRAFSALGLSQANMRLAEALFGMEQFSQAAAWCVAGQLGWFGLGAVVVLWRLRRWRGV